MWKASPQEGRALYILGSLHFAISACYPLPREIERAYSVASVVGIEVDVTKPQSAEVAAWLGRYGSHGRLKRDVPAFLLKEVQGLARKYKWDLDSISQTRPWAVAAMLTATDLEAHGYVRSMGIDLHFIRSAKRDSKRIVELDPAREQFDTFNALSRDDQVFLLKESVQAIKSGGNANAFGKLIEAWRSGDSVAFERLTRESLSDAPDPEALGVALYRARNEKMAERIQTLVRGDDQVFVVVGAAHLAGPYSLLGMLQRMGFEVEQVVDYSQAGGYPSE
jgi:hypothetical protein